MKQLILLLLFIPVWLSAQTDDARYLAGAVPMKNGKVVFEKEIRVPDWSKQQIYETLLAWAKETYKTPERQVVYTNPDKGEIAIVSQEYVIFSSTALALDRALTTYRLMINCADQTANLEMSGIRYKYDVTYQREPEIYTAEEWINDKMALNGKKTKLNHIAGKFRKATIDLADNIFKEATNALGAGKLHDNQPAVAVQPTEPQEKPVAVAEQSVVAQPVAATSTPATAATEMAGYKTFAPEQVPESLLQLLPESRMLLTEQAQGNEEKQASWKGVGKLMGKSFASVAIQPSSAAYKAIGENGTFRLSFYKQGDEQPWFLIDCRKQGETSDGSQKVILGEIIQVKVK